LKGIAGERGFAAHFGAFQIPSTHSRAGAACWRVGQTREEGRKIHGFLRVSRKVETKLQKAVDPTQARALEACYRTGAAPDATNHPVANRYGQMSPIEMLEEQQLSAISIR
jgi:SOS-response transcriptional repressor LexA